MTFLYVRGYTSLFHAALKAHLLAQIYSLINAWIFVHTSLLSSFNVVEVLPF